MLEIRKKLLQQRKVYFTSIQFCQDSRSNTFHLQYDEKKRRSFRVKNEKKYSAYKIDSFNQIIIGGGCTTSCSSIRASCLYNGNFHILERKQTYKQLLQNQRKNIEIENSQSLPMTKNELMFWLICRNFEQLHWYLMDSHRRRRLVLPK